MNREYDVIEEMKRFLDEQVENLDTKTASRIATVRKVSLEKAKKRRISWCWPAAGLVTTAAAALFALIFMFPSGSPKITAEHMEFLEMLSADNGIEVYEDLEFYSWLAQNNPDNGEG